MFVSTHPLLLFTQLLNQVKADQRKFGVFANVFAEGVYQRIDLELGKTHDEYEKQINEYIEF